MTSSTPKTATLIVSRSYSKCSACGNEVLPDEVAHYVTSGWQGRKPGCGATFTAITSDNTRLDDLHRAMLASMRPDLPIVEYGSWEEGS
jgi:hypothetical protein